MLSSATLLALGVPTPSSTGTVDNLVGNLVPSILLSGTLNKDGVATGNITPTVTLAGTLSTSAAAPPVGNSSINSAIATNQGGAFLTETGTNTSGLSGAFVADTVVVGVPGSGTFVIIEKPDTIQFTNIARYVQGGNVIGSNTGLSYSITLPNPVGNNNCLIVAFGSLLVSGDTVTITDDKGNLYTLVDTSPVNPDNMVVRTAFLLHITNAPQIITVTYHIISGALNRYCVMFVDEFSPSFNDIDAHIINLQTNPAASPNTITSGNLFTTQNGDFIYGVTFEPEQTSTIQPGTGFTTLQYLTQVASNEYSNQSNAGVIAATFTPSALAKWVSAALAFTYVISPPIGTFNFIEPPDIIIFTQPHWVQGGIGQTPNNNRALGVFTNPVGYGDMVIVTVFWKSTNGDTATCTDDQNNIYNIIGYGLSTVNNYLMVQFYCLNITNGPKTITATINMAGGTGRSIGIVVEEFTPSVAMLDGNSVNAQYSLPAGSNNITSGLITTTNPNDLIYGFTFNPTGNNSAWNIIGTGFSSGTTGTYFGNTLYVGEYLYQITAGSIAATYYNEIVTDWLTSVVAFGTPVAVGPSGPFSFLEPLDTVAFNGNVAWTSAFTINEIPDTIAFIGSVGLIINGSINFTEPPDTVAFAGSVYINVIANWIEPPDWYDIEGVVGLPFLYGIFNWTEPPDTFVNIGRITVFGTADFVDPFDTITFSAIAVNSGTLLIQEAPDTITFGATAATNGTFTIQEVPDSITNNGFVTWLATFTITELPDTITFAATSINKGTLTIQEDPDTILFAGTGLTASGPFAWIEPPDIFAYNGLIAWRGIFVWIEPPDTFAYNGNVYISGPFTISELSDAIINTGTVTTFGTLTLQELPDTINATGNVYTGGVLSFIETPDTITFAASQGWQGIFNWIEPPDTIIFTGASTISGNFDWVDPPDLFSFDGSGIKFRKNIDEMGTRVGADQMEEV